METNKPFKTISLEQRLAQSVMAKFDPEKTKQAPKWLEQLNNQSYQHQHNSSKVILAIETLEKHTQAFQKTLG